MSTEAVVTQLFEHYKALAGDPQSAAMLTLAHAQLAGQAEKPADAPLTPAEAADFLGVSTDLVYDLCNKGQLRHQRLGRGRGIIRINRSDLAAIAKETTREIDNGSNLFAKHAAARRRRA